MKTVLKYAEVTGYWSSEIDNLWGWVPDDNSVWYLLNMSIGIKGEIGTNDYSIIVATPDGIKDLLKNEYSFAEIQKILLLDFYSWEKVLETIHDKISKLESTNSANILWELSKIFYWEYDSFR